MSHTRIPYRSAWLTAGTLLLTACGGESTAPAANKKLSAQEAMAVAAALFQEVSMALGDASFSRAGHVATSAVLLPTLTINQPCSNGGRIAGSITVTDNTNAEGTGTISANMVVTPRACVVSTGTQTLAVNGHPSLTYAFTAALKAGEPTSDLVWHAGGGIAWDGGSCDVNYDVRITLQGSASISGTACGQDISGKI